MQAVNTTFAAAGADNVLCHEGSLVSTNMTATTLPSPGNEGNLSHVTDFSEDLQKHSSCQLFTFLLCLAEIG